MLTILEVLRKSTEFLHKAEVPNARLDAEWIISHCLNMGRMDLYLQFERPLEEEKLCEMRGMITRRSKREPLQHILGHVTFADLRLTCDKRSLIPRPETEELVEIILTITRKGSPEKFLDLGTGSGALALALAKAFPSAQIVATDISERALELAIENANANNLSGRIEFLSSDWFEGLPLMTEGFDLIVSNPPYLSEEEWESTEPEVKRYDPKKALVSGEGGSRDLQKILRDSEQYLNPQGWLAMETGEYHHEELANTAKAIGYEKILKKKDLAGRPRFFLAKRAEVSKR